VFDRSAPNAEHLPDFLVSALARRSGRFLAILALFGVLFVADAERWANVYLAAWCGPALYGAKKR
jgi:hypothetical protein